MWSIPQKFAQFLQHPPIGITPSDKDVEGFQTLAVVDRFYPAGAMLMEEGQTRRAELLIASGWALSYKMTSNGQRVVTDFPQRGDLLNTGIAGKVHRSVQATTDVTTFEIDFQRSPPSTNSSLLTDMIMRALRRNCDMSVEHLANISRRRPLQRTAFLFLEIGYRHWQSGLGDIDCYDFPFTQRDLADALGLTPIHTNRILRDLREGGLVRFQHWKVELMNRPILIEMTAFEPGYLEHALDLHR